MAEASTPQFDGNTEGAGFVGSFFTPEFIENPYPSYRFLLEHQPLFQVPDAPCTSPRATRTARRCSATGASATPSRKA